MPVWQAIRETYKDQNFELVTVGFDALGADGCRPFIEAANPSHPALIDRHHLLASLYGFVNIPQAIWINEDFKLVRPVEGAPPPPADEPPPPPELPPELPSRMMEIMGEAAKIKADPEAYHAGIKDWIEKGDASEFALSPDEVIERSTPRSADESLGHAHFEMACELEQRGQHDLAIQHFQQAHKLVPDSWTFRRQAWSLEMMGDGPLARFWQGPDPENPDAWPYEGDWLADIRREGPANYYKPFKK